MEVMSRFSPRVRSFLEVGLLTIALLAGAIALIAIARILGWA
jgi:hypothetical protein